MMQYMKQDPASSRAVVSAFDDTDLTSVGLVAASSKSSKSNPCGLSAIVSGMAKLGVKGPSVSSMLPKEMVQLVRDNDSLCCVDGPSGRQLAGVSANAAVIWKNMRLNGYGLFVMGLFTYVGSYLPNSIAPTMKPYTAVVLGLTGTHDNIKTALKNLNGGSPSTVVAHFLRMVMLITSSGYRGSLKLSKITQMPEEFYRIGAVSTSDIADAAADAGMTPAEMTKIANLATPTCRKFQLQVFDVKAMISAVKSQSADIKQMDAVAAATTFIVDKHVDELATLEDDMWDWAALIVRTMALELFQKNIGEQLTFKHGQNTVVIDGATGRIVAQQAEQMSASRAVVPVA